MPLSPRARLGLIVLGVAVVTHVLVVLAFPRLLMHVALTSIAKRAGTNTAYAAARPDHTFRSIVRPSPDLLYSVCVLDLADEHVVIDVRAELPASYGSLAVYDAATDVVTVLGDRDVRGAPARLVVARAGVHVPAHDGTRVVRLPSAHGLLLQRVLVPDEAALPTVDAVRRTLSCTARRIGAR